MSTRADGKATDESEPVIVVGYVAAVLFPVLGFVLGLTQINRHVEGLRIVMVSAAAALIYSAAAAFCFIFISIRT